MTSARIKPPLKHILSLCPRCLHACMPWKMRGDRMTSSAASTVAKADVTANTQSGSEAGNYEVLNIGVFPSMVQKIWRHLGMRV